MRSTTTPSHPPPPPPHRHRRTSSGNNNSSTLLRHSIASAAPLTSREHNRAATGVTWEEQEGHRHQQQQQRQFRMWASASIDRARALLPMQSPSTRGPRRDDGTVGAAAGGVPSSSSSSPAEEDGGEQLPSSSAAGGSIIGAANDDDGRRSPVESARGHSVRRTTTEEDRERERNRVEEEEEREACFLSDPSTEEEEDESTALRSSLADRAKKASYARRLREFDRSRGIHTNNNNNNHAGGGHHDAPSVGDTSLSSSNMSPAPRRFFIQFEGSATTSAATSARGAGGDGGGRSSFAPSRAASSSSGRGGGGVVVAVAPPPPLPDLRANPNRRPSPSREGTVLGECDRPMGDRPVMGDRSVESADSVRGVGIATEQRTEQCGGESSCSAFRGFDAVGKSGNDRDNGDGDGNYPPPRLDGLLPDGYPSFDPSAYVPSNIMPAKRADASPPDANDLARRARRRSSFGHHRRMRSGDAAAAAIVNLGREDWIGMSMDNIPMPDAADDDDTGSGSALRGNVGGGEGAGGGGTPPGRRGEPPDDRGGGGDDVPSSASPRADPHGAGGGDDASRGRSTPTASVTDGYSADASSRGIRRPHPPVRFSRRADSTISADTFDFSESASGRRGGIDGADAEDGTRTAATPRVAGGSFERERDGRRHRSRPSNGCAADMAWLNSYQMANQMHRGDHNNNHVGNYNHQRSGSFLPGGNHQRNGSFLPNGNNHQRNGSFLPNNNHQRNGSFLPNNNHQRNGSFLPVNFNLQRQDTFNSQSSSGLSASCTSSSYSDNTEWTKVKKDEAGEVVRGGPRKSVRIESPPKDSKFDRAMKRVQSVLNVPLYRDNDDEGVDDTKKVPMFWCPNCKTKQRDFINIDTASGLYDSPQGYLALGFALYLVASLFVFGLQEGWEPLDCVYFAVITLTTAGLGDFVPSTDGGKMVCALFIYIGVATIGLLLGSLLAGSMDSERKGEAREAQIRDCPNCARFERIQRRSTPDTNTSFYNMGFRPGEMKQNLSYTPSDSGSQEDSDNVGLDLVDSSQEGSPTKVPRINSSFSTQQTQAQIHTRHMSLDIVGASMRKIVAASPALGRASMNAGMPPLIDETTPFLATADRPPNTDSGTAPNLVDMMSLDDSYSVESTSLHKPLTRGKAAKYIFKTLNQALGQSIFIIVVGSFGFYFLEDISGVDAFYFTTVLLTSVGYGDIVPVTTAGKVFATLFVIGAGTVLLHNMTLISMIPLELRKQRIEHAVLEQFGSHLTDDELRELSTGRLINRLDLAANGPNGQEECTREMFSLAMLVRLGRISENDVKATFAAFKRLDIGDHGKLNSRTIIEGEYLRQKSVRNLVELSPPGEWDQPSQHYSMNSMAHMSQEQSYAADYAHHFTSPGNESLQRNPSMGSGVVSHASEFDYDAYERWANQFHQYPPSPPAMNNNMGAY